MIEMDSSDNFSLSKRFGVRCLGLMYEVTFVGRDLPFALHTPTEINLCC